VYLIAAAAATLNLAADLAVAAVLVSAHEDAVLPKECVVFMNQPLGWVKTRPSDRKSVAGSVKLVTSSVTPQSVHGGDAGSSCVKCRISASVE
jgi:DNA repair protein RadA/Sms